MNETVVSGKVNTARQELILPTNIHSADLRMHGAISQEQNMTTVVRIAWKIGSVIGSQMFNGVRRDWTGRTGDCWRKGKLNQLACLLCKERRRGRKGRTTEWFAFSQNSDLLQHTWGQSRSFVCDKVQFHDCLRPSAADDEKHQDIDSFRAPLDEGHKGTLTKDLTIYVKLTTDQQPPPPPSSSSLPGFVAQASSQAATSCNNSLITSNPWKETLAQLKQHTDHIWVQGPCVCVTTP